jgi:hypothetical protein
MLSVNADDENESSSRCGQVDVVTACTVCFRYYFPCRFAAQPQGDSIRNLFPTIEKGQVNDYTVAV